MWFENPRKMNACISARRNDAALLNSGTFLLSDAATLCAFGVFPDAVQDHRLEHARLRRAMVALHPGNAACDSMKDLLQKGPRALMLRIAEEILRLADFDDLAVIHENDTIGHLTGETHFV
jgi:hypothetical protein